MSKVVMRKRKSTRTEVCLNLLDPEQYRVAQIPIPFERFQQELKRIEFIKELEQQRIFHYKKMKWVFREDWNTPFPIQVTGYSFAPKTEQERNQELERACLLSLLEERYSISQIVLYLTNRGIPAQEALSLWKAKGDLVRFQLIKKLPLLFNDVKQASGYKKQLSKRPPFRNQPKDYPELTVDFYIERVYAVVGNLVFYPALYPYYRKYIYFHPRRTGSGLGSSKLMRLRQKQIESRNTEIETKRSYHAENKAL